MQDLQQSPALFFFSTQKINFSVKNSYQTFEVSRNFVDKSLDFSENDKRNEISTKKGTPKTVEKPVENVHNFSKKVGNTPFLSKCNFCKNGKLRTF